MLCTALTVLPYARVVTFEVENTFKKAADDEKNIKIMGIDLSVKEFQKYTRSAIEITLRMFRQNRL